MGIDINLLRKDRGGDPEKVRDSQIKRFQDPKVVDELLAMDEIWRKKKFHWEQLRKELHQNQNKITEKKKANKQDPCEEELKKKVQLEQEIKEAEQEVKNAEEPMMKKLSTIGNIVHESVPVSNDEKNNAIVRTWGEPKKLEINDTPGHAHHHQILWMLDGYEPKKGAKVAGHRGYFLKNCGVLLNLALQNYGMQFLVKKGYVPVQPPFFMKKEIMGETCQLSDFDDQLYKVIATAPKKEQQQQKQEEPNQKEEEKQQKKEENHEEDKEFYLIATSEQPISAIHRGEHLDPKNLPIRYAGISTCFRKEAGAHGRETWGIFRIHQFEKIEQFVYTLPEDSYNEHDKMVAISEEFMQSLELPYRLVAIVSGALNDAAAKKIDLEAWFPGYGEFKELNSISNCTDFQARNLDIRLQARKKDQKSEDKEFCHMLNGTLCATERTLTCILENYQEEKGLRIPKVLVPYVGADFIPYTKPMPKKTDFE